ncbi:MAG TPA: FHA domain-containing protein, partial [Kofleriaceae bacterium]|nr:FHA domain-containing protein [Kofleriaceae bacterium]
MPKAKPFSDGDEDERTTIESQWEDEASTTVEQGDVADKIKSLGVERRGNTNLTHTGAMDEPTVDDQHAPVLSAITPLRADQNARLAITQGNDTGQTFEIRPGKTYTIGRAIDNDVVLTDIAVSRKHFDLRHEDGAWVIVDRGSGNGTVVNGNVEDNPFMLANGDLIEIGNTVFRFEQEKGPVRSDQRTMDLPDEEEELSTVAGKPLRPEILEIEPAPTPVVGRPQRPKTLPPPMPLRSVGASQPPPLGMPPQPASTLPLPQMANRPPLAHPGMPTMLGDSHGRPLPGMPPQNGMHHNGMAPTTLPGQPAPPRPSYPYPQATEIPPHSVHAQMLLVQSQNRRGDASTAHVPPMSYDPMLGALPPLQQQRYTPPQLSSRAKYILAGAGLAILAAIATIGIVKSSSAKPKAEAATTNGSASQPKKKKTGPTVEAIKPDAPK